VTSTISAASRTLAGERDHESTGGEQEGEAEDDAGAAVIQ